MPYADALAGIAKPARVSASDSINMLMNAEALAGYDPKVPEGLLESCLLPNIYRTKMLLGITAEPLCNDPSHDARMDSYV